MLDGLRIFRKARGMEPAIHLFYTILAQELPGDDQ
jgi:hypothetical protein